MDILKKVKTVTAKVANKQKVVIAEDELEDLVTDNDEQFESQTLKEDDERLTRYLKKVDWTQLAESVDNNHYMEQFPLVNKLTNLLVVRKPNTVADLLSVIKCLDATDLLLQVYMFKKKIHNPVVKIALGIVVVVMKRVKRK